MSSFCNFNLNSDLLKAIKRCQIMHPSEGMCRNEEIEYMKTFSVQFECIPEAIKGKDISCHSRSGCGKTTAYIISTLQLLEPIDGQVSILVLCHSSAMVTEIGNKYMQLTNFLPNIKVN